MFEAVELAENRSSPALPKVRPTELGPRDMPEVSAFPDWVMLRSLGILMVTIASGGLEHLEFHTLRHVGTNKALWYERALGSAPGSDFYGYE